MPLDIEPRAGGSGVGTSGALVRSVAMRPVPLAAPQRSQCDSLRLFQELKDPEPSPIFRNQAYVLAWIIGWTMVGLTLATLGKEHVMLLAASTLFGHAL